jgi:hypothetical protein
MTTSVLRAISLIAALLLAACNLNTTADNTGGAELISGPPQVRIAAPPPNATFLEGVDVNIQALVSNAGTDIDRVEVAIDDELVATRDDPNAAGAPAFTVQERWTALDVGSHTITITALRGDGTASTPATVTINVVDQSERDEPVVDSDDPTEMPDASGQAAGNGDEDDDTAGPASADPTDEPAEPTETPEPEATATPSTPTASFTVGVNVRAGPDVLFNPPIGSFAAGDTTEVLAVNPAGTWYKVRYYNSEGWVFGNLLEVSGDEASLPRDPGPPVPTLTPVPPTPVPATATPNINVNLVAGNITLDPNQPVCNETFNIFFDVANLGENRSPGGTIRVVDSVGGNSTDTVGAFGEIDPGQTIRVGPIPLTVSFNFEEQHTLRLTIDPNNQIAETNENDNARDLTYTLQKGGC